MDTLDKVQLVHGQSPVRPARTDNVHGFSGHCPWTQWTLSMDSVYSLDIVHGHPGQSPGSPGGLDNVFLKKTFWLFELITSKPLSIHNI